jgi:hypothetical protein
MRLSRPNLRPTLPFARAPLVSRHVPIPPPRLHETHVQTSARLQLRAVDRCVAMKRFGYARDPVCVVACVCYGVNRWLLPASLRGPFMRNHFSDVLLIPAALPLLLWLQRRLGLRLNDAKPQWSEIFLHFVVWSIAAEGVAPHLFAHAVGDPWDVVAYAGGALVSGLIWQLG